MSEAPFRFVEKLATATWLCEPAHVEFLHGIFLRYLDRAASGQPLNVEAVEREFGRKLDNTREVSTRGGVARIPVEGTIMRRASLFTAMSGGVSTETLMKDFQKAHDDPHVHSILFVFDTPGGEVSGIHELAAAIREKRDEHASGAPGSKPIEAYCDGLCASAGYWLASATDRITTNATGELGSIGVVATVRNPDAVAKRGDVELVSTKSPLKRPNPNTQAGRDTLQAHVDALANVFIGSVAENRGISTESVVNDYGRGFVLVGEEAVAAGLADAVGSEEEVTRRLIEEHDGRAGRRTLRPAGNLAMQTNREVTVEQQTTRRPEAAPDESFAEPRQEVGIVRRVMSALGVVAADVATADNETPTGRAAEQPAYDRPPGGNPNAPQVVSYVEPVAADHRTHPTPLGTVSGEEANSEVREETENGMDQQSSTGVPVDPIEEANEVTETNTSAVTREEFERMEARLEEANARNARHATVIRSNGIEAMLRREGAVRLENGAMGVTPPAQMTAAKTLIEQMAAAGDDLDPIELSASGEARLRDTPGGQAVRSLLTPWRPQELGERGTVEGETRAEGGAGDHAMVMAELEKQGLDMDHYGAVAARLIAGGEIRRDVPGPS